MAKGINLALYPLASEYQRGIILKPMQKTRRALFVSTLSMVTCCALLLGTTFAWFTDSATNAGNKIESGTLSIELNKENDKPVFSSGSDFQWEPGRSQKAGIQLENTGSLWLKYNLSFTNVKTEGNADITEVLDVYKVQKPAADVTKEDLNQQTYLGTMKTLMGAGKLENEEGFLAPAGYTGKDGSSTAVFTLVIAMQEGAGNQYQGSTAAFDIEASATQYTYETDGFGSKEYDKDATLNFQSVSDEAELSAAIAEGKTVLLAQDITLAQKITAAGDVTIVGNGNSLTTSEGVDRVLDMQNLTESATITLNNVNLEGPKSGTYTRGISLYNNSQPVTLIMDGCSVSANYYAINVASANQNVKAVIRNSTITGWCAFQTHSPQADITFENCTLQGVNDKTYNADGWNNFATIVVNGYTDGNPDPDGAHDCTLTFKNCRMEATQTTGNKQFLLSVRAANTTINAENCTFYVDGEQIPATVDAISPYIGVSSTEIAETLTFNLQ